MGVSTGVSVEEYLHSSFPGIDREYRDGALVERSMPDYLHGKTQALLNALFMALRKELRLYPCSETRMKLRAGRFLIPDVAVFHPDEPGLVPDTPPLIAIEILSPDDRLSEVREKLEECRAWGVPHVWLVDPHSRRLYNCDEDCGKYPASRSANWLLK
jgi:Uma2 family endonuclease